MKFKKKVYLLIIPFLFLLNSCEKDDVCLGASTPKLVIRFYEYNQSNTKPTTDLTIIALPDRDTLYKQSAVDSIALSLDVNKNFTEYVFLESNNPDTLKVSYDLHPYFVSKACGYIMFFKNLNVELKPDNNLWIKQIEITQSEVKIDTSAHVKIYH